MTAVETEAESREITPHPIVELGRSTRFQKGNKVAVGHGRPKKPMTAVYDAISRRALEELWLVACDASHPLHRRHAFDALIALARVTTPKRIVQTGNDKPGSSEASMDINALFPGSHQGHVPRREAVVGNLAAHDKEAALATETTADTRPRNQRSPSWAVESTK